MKTTETPAKLFALFGIFFAMASNASAQLLPFSEFGAPLATSNEGVEALEEQLGLRPSKLIAGNAGSYFDSPRNRSQKISPNSLERGSLGYFDPWERLTVTQVISGTEAILAAINPERPQVLKSPQFVLSGYPTSGLADGDLVRLDGLLEATSTRRLTSVQGATSTLWVLTFVSKAKLEAIAEAKEKAREESLYREWTTKDGNFSVEAIFVDYENGSVSLKKRDGSTIDVKATLLSSEDVSYYRSVLRRNVARKRSRPR